MSATVDACTLIAFLDPRNAQHERAVALMASLTPPLWIHPLNLAEVLVPFADRRGALDQGRWDRGGPEYPARRVWRDIERIGVRVYTEALGDDTSHAIDLAEIRHETRVKMPDACVIATAWESSTPIASLDDRLVAAARKFDPVDVVDPPNKEAP